MLQATLREKPKTKKHGTASPWGRLGLLRRRPLPRQQIEVDGELLPAHLHVAAALARVGVADAVLHADGVEHVVRELAAEEHKITYRGAIKTFDDDTVAVAAMKAGRIEAYASTLVSLLSLANSVEGVTVIPFTSDKWSQEFTAMAFRKEDETFRNAINDTIVAMKQDGTLAGLQKKWFGQSFVNILPNKAPEW